MSTRATLWYSEKVHIYEELLEDNSVHLEYEDDGVTINFPLMTIDEWKHLTAKEMRLWQHDETGRLCYSASQPSARYYEVRLPVIGKEQNSNEGDNHA